MNKLIVYGQPHPMQRPRFSSRGGIVHTYPTLKDKRYKKDIQDAFEEQKEQGKVITLEDTEKPLEVKIWAFMAIPKSTAKAQRKLIEEGKILPTKRNGDCDNIAKIIIDALAGYMFMADDSRVVHLEVTKHFAIDDTPRVEVEIDYLDNNN